MIKRVISFASDMVSMLHVIWRMYVNKVVINFVKHSCLLTEPICIK